MAFMSLIFVFIILFIVILIAGISSLIIGNILYKKDNHKKLGMFLKILGYTILLPVAVGVVSCILTAVFS